MKIMIQNQSFILTIFYYYGLYSLYGTHILTVAEWFIVIISVDQQKKAKYFVITNHPEEDFQLQIVQITLLSSPKNQYSKRIYSLNTF